MDFTSSIWTTALLLFFIIDPFGNVPLILGILKPLDKSHHRRIIVREMLIGLAVLLFFLFFGAKLLELFQLETSAVTLAGGIIFFIIAIKLIFPNSSGEGLFGSSKDPFIVPIAIPMIAGPSALATLLVLAQSGKQSLTELTLSLLIAWSCSAVILYFSPTFYRLLGAKGLEAMEKLMGMLLLMMAVQMMINGLRTLSLNWPS